MPTPSLQSLLIISNPAIHERAVFCLQQANCRFIPVETLARAEEQLNSDSSFDFIALTASENIKEILTSIRHEYEFSSLPIILFAETVEEAATAMDLGANSFLLSPYNPQELSLRLRNLIRYSKQNIPVRIMGEFMLAAGHELRTPLNGITGLTDILLEEIQNGKAREYLADMKGITKQLSIIITNMHDFCAPVPAGESIPRHPFNLKEIISAAKDDAISQFAGKGITVRIDIPADIPDTLFGFPERIRKIFLNLIDSSLRLSPAGGTIIISAQRGVINNGEQSIVCSVRDNGLGLDQERFSSFFDSFTHHQPHDNFSFHDLGSTGIGLAAALRLAQSMGGTISAESEPDYGCIFYVTFNTSHISETPQHAMETDHHHSAQNAFNILLVEDNPVNLKIAMWQLTKLGYPHQVAVNGEEALTLWRKGNFDLILMDVQMPVLDGLMATRLIREEESGGNKHVPIIALTAYGSEQSELPCLEAGMDGFVTKPVRADELARIISQVSKH